MSERKKNVKEEKITFEEDSLDEEKDVEVKKKVKKKTTTSKKNTTKKKVVSKEKEFDLDEEVISEAEDLDKSSRKKNKIFKIIMVILLIVFFIVLLGFSYYYLILPSIELKGNKNVTLEYSTTYKEKGYSAKHFGKDITSKVKVKDNINYKKLGKYEITYTVKNKGLTKEVIRNVSIVDTKKPTLRIDSSDSYVCPGDEYIKESVETIDNYDGDISTKVKVDISKEKDKVVYSVVDSSNNKNSVTKNILYKDIEKPVIKLNGSELMSVYVGESFTDPLYEVTDNCDGEVTVNTNGSVNTGVIGEYTLEYVASDDYGNSSSISRKVIVKKRNSPGTIYLTFDDGPKEGTTNVILDILRDEGVKATFFVTNTGPDYLIKRMYDEGHTVALHTATHDYQKVYSSVDGYYNDLYSVQERVKRITGHESKIIRFPGGSSNTVSRKYNQGIMSTLTQDVLNRGFRYYDWNLSSGDAAGGSPTATTIYNNVVNSLRRDRVNMVLMHDIKTYTRDSLRDIIRYGKNNGYTFEKITMETDMIRQKVNN